VLWFRAANLHMKKGFSILRYCSPVLVLLFISAKPPATATAEIGLEDVVVEKYYVSSSAEKNLPEGAVTYRIFIDLKEGYKLQAVYGVAGHEFFFKTTTGFFNAPKNGGKMGDQIDEKEINDDAVAFDSWLTINAATKTRVGVLRADDKDGSIINNRKKQFKKTDGIISGKVPSIINYMLDLTPFDDGQNVSVFHTADGSLATFESTKGPTESNKILIAQLTTNGKLSFKLNLQVSTPDCKVANYVAENPQGNEIQANALIYQEK
jgi:hypothetical protein